VADHLHQSVVVAEVVAAAVAGEAATEAAVDQPGADASPKHLQSFRLPPHSCCRLLTATAEDYVGCSTQWHYPQKQ